MKLALCSDLHLEYGTIDLHNTENAEVLILSGDVCVASRWKKETEEFFTNCSQRFPHVIYIMGNHEHYKGDFNETENTLRQYLKDFDNVYLLEKQHKTIGDVTFIGGTLWTDMNNEDPVTLYSIRGVMNDFRVVKNFMPERSVDEHKKLLDYIDAITNGFSDMKFVVVGHHAPSKLSTHPRYADEVLINGAYSSNLNEFILDHPQIKLWTHGHTHEQFDYNIGETRIIANPRGYINYEKCADYFELKFLEV
jgi:predicted phosphodiesterase